MTTHDSIDRRTALGALGLTTAGLTAAGMASAAIAQPAAVPAASPLTPALLGWDEAKGEYVLPPLPYAPEALEPHIDAQTMQIHHGRHHKSYVDGLNRALKNLRDIRAGQADPALVKHWSREVSFHGAGHINHALFWLMMAPASNGGGGMPKAGPLASAIERDFGSFEAFTAHFKAAAIQVEASGWAWLVLDHASKRLLIIQGEKQQNLFLTGATPLLGIDVWEHAYYLKYQNKRADYVNAFFNVIHWAFVEKLYNAAIG
jgi:Fe-Mn family superoxide dismutase